LIVRNGAEEYYRLTTVQHFSHEAMIVGVFLDLNEKKKRLKRERFNPFGIRKTNKRLGIHAKRIRTPLLEFKNVQLITGIQG